MTIPTLKVENIGSKMTFTGNTVCSDLDKLSIKGYGTSREIFLFNQRVHVKTIAHDTACLGRNKGQGVVDKTSNVNEIA